MDTYIAFIDLEKACDKLQEEKVDIIRFADGIARLSEDEKGLATMIE